MGRTLGTSFPADELYFDQTDFCRGYRRGTITTEIPAPECYDRACRVGIDPGCFGPPTGAPTKFDEYGNPVFTDVQTGKQPFPWWILLAVAGGVIVLKKSRK